MQVVERPSGFDVVEAGRVILRHGAEAPCLFVGRGEPEVQMQRGNFKIADYLVERIGLRAAAVTYDGEAVTVAFAPQAGDAAVLTMTLDKGAMAFSATDPSLNRFWIRLAAEAGEHVWGGGEQMSYFDLRGRRFPLWTSEPGVGRDKTRMITLQADLTGAGGDYFNTNYPQPTYVSSRLYALHIDTTAYSVFDFRHDGFHEIEVWEIPARIEVWARDTFVEIVGVLSERFGRQPQLPAWVLEGAIVGLKQGAESFDRLQTFLDAGVAVSGLWCEDWVGLRVTSFGKRLFWDWKWNPKRYPNLDTQIGELRAKGIRFLGYVNPYLAVDGSFYQVAKDAGYLALTLDGSGPYVVDFGEFDCGVVDFTIPAACAWFEDEIIGRQMLDFGLSGWMADFGEYLPTDVRLANGVDGMLMHNAWPTLWAEVNARAVAKKGMTGEALFFLRAGYTGVQAHCPLLWAGDQSVDFSRHDGIGTVICGALSSGLLGNAYHHSDIGGYTSLFGHVRTAELLMRWSEMAAFTPVMRSHEGNRPDENLQLDGDPHVLSHFARMTKVYRRLAPYVARLSREAAATGLPLQRPMFLHFQDDPRTYADQTQYLYGADLLVAPVIEEGALERKVYLPAGATWVNVWTGESQVGGEEIGVRAALGYPPVFYRQGSADTALFAGLAQI